VGADGGWAWERDVTRWGEARNLTGLKLGEANEGKLTPAEGRGNLLTPGNGKKKEEPESKGEIKEQMFKVDETGKAA